MRKLAQFHDHASAHALREALQREDIVSDLRTEGDDSHAVWVLAEDQIADARRVLAELPERIDVPAPPAAPTAANATAPGTGPRPIRARRPQASANSSLRARAAGAPVTVSVLALSITMSLASNFGSRVGVLRHFTIAGNIFLPGHGYDDILAGELWRLITPVFIHFGVLHLVFNAFWLLDVGAAIERVLGSLRFGTFLAFCAAASNAAQLYFGLSAMFGGLSGLVYACVGYLWSRGRFDPHSPIGAPPQLVTFFVVWLILGFTGALFDLVGNVANYCHLGGLIAGVACGYVAALSSKPRVPRSAQQ